MEITKGKIFTLSYQGMTATSRLGIVEKRYEIIEKNPSGNWNCKLIYSNTTLNGDIINGPISQFTEEEILKNLNK